MWRSITYLSASQRSPAWVISILKTNSSEPGATAARPEAVAALLFIAPNRPFLSAFASGARTTSPPAVSASTNWPPFAKAVHCARRLAVGRSASAFSRAANCVSSACTLSPLNCINSHRLRRLSAWSNTNKSSTANPAIGWPISSATGRRFKSSASAAYGRAFQYTRSMPLGEDAPLPFGSHVTAKCSRLPCTQYKASKQSMCTTLSFSCTNTPPLFESFTIGFPSASSSVSKLSSGAVSHSFTSRICQSATVQASAFANAGNSIRNEASAAVSANQPAFPRIAGSRTCTPAPAATLASPTRGLPMAPSKS